MRRDPIFKTVNIFKILRISWGSENNGIKGVFNRRRILILGTKRKSVCISYVKITPLRKMAKKQKFFVRYGKSVFVGSYLITTTFTDYKKLLKGSY